MLTPLNAIKGFVQTMNTLGVENKLTHEKREELLQCILTAENILEESVNDLLDVALIEKGIKLRSEEVSLSELSVDILKEAKNKSASKGYTKIEASIPEDLPHIKADGKRLRRVIANLLDNAVKFTDSGTIELNAADIGNMIEISVSDTGPGIPSDRHKDIFDKFIQLNQDERKHTFGVGLYICKKLVELMEGQIWLESESDKGSTFHFTVPKWMV